MDIKEKESWIKAGRLGSQIMQKALKLAKPETPLLEIAEKLEEEAKKLNVQWAFPINLSINEIAAHASPTYDDKRVAEGLLKIDLGISVDGYISDIARSVDLTPNQVHKEMIKANEKALQEAIKITKHGIPINEIGKKIHEIITQAGFSPIRNLSGHEMQRYDLHAGINIPNFDNKNPMELDEGIYAIEPFATTGDGVVKDGKPSPIFMMIDKKPARDPQSRKILEFIEKNYHTLPFTSRWIVKEFSPSSLLRLNSLALNDTLHNFAELVEQSRKPVSQAEHTILVEKNKITVLTE